MCTIGSVMSFFSTSDVTLESEKPLDPDIGLQSHMLTFRAPTGLLCIINASLPTFPRTTRQRLLNCYADAAAKYNADHILIGGASHNSVVFMENQVSKLNLDFEFFSLKDLYLLAHAADKNPVRCYDLDSSGPYSLMAIIRSVEQPAPRRSAEQPPPRKAAKLTARSSVEQPPAPRQALTLKSATPLYDRLFANLEDSVDEHHAGKAFVQYITDCCFFDKLLNMEIDILITSIRPWSESLGPSSPRHIKFLGLSKLSRVA